MLDRNENSLLGEGGFLSAFVIYQGIAAPETGWNQASANMNQQPGFVSSPTKGPQNLIILLQYNGIWWCSFIRCHFCQRRGGIFGRSPALSLTSDGELLGTWLALRKVLLEIYLECLKIKTRASFTVSDLRSCQCWWTSGLWSQPPLKSGRRLTDHPATGLERLMAETINGLGVARAIAICQHWGTCCPVFSCL